MYQALYRKYRPRGFDDVVGQEHVTRTLRRQVDMGRLSHAYLFVGTRGTGKTTCARILAKAANCEHPVDGNPCNCCASCRGIDSGAILDVEELDAASNNGVDDIRTLREEAVFSPAEVRKRIYIIDEVHMLSGSAFNALLKILEEPPEHIIFILATTEVQKVLPTILSRCQRFTFRRLTVEEIAGRLSDVAKRENISLTPGAAAMLGRLADGSMRDGMSLLDQCLGEGAVDEELVTSVIGLAGTAKTEALLQCVTAKDASGALSILGELYAAGKSLESVLGELLTLLRDILVSKVTSGGIGLLSGSYDPETLKKFGGAIPNGRLSWSIELLQSAVTGLRNTADKRTAAELCLIRMAKPELSTDTQALLTRIEALEEGGVRAVPMTETPRSVPAAPIADKRPEPPAPVKAPEPELPPEPAPVQEAEPLPEPAPVPEAEPVPEPVRAEAETIPGPQLWRAILESVEVPFPASMFLGDPQHIEAFFNGTSFVLYTKTELSAAPLRDQELLRRIRQEAERLTGGSVTVETTAQPPKLPSQGMVQGGTPVRFVPPTLSSAPAARPVQEVPQDHRTADEKLAALAKFGNVVIK